jgi:hypothetical protein
MASPIVMQAVAAGEGAFKTWMLRFSSRSFLEPEIEVVALPTPGEGNGNARSVVLKRRAKW